MQTCFFVQALMEHLIEVFPTDSVQHESSESLLFTTEDALIGLLIESPGELVSRKDSNEATALLGI